MVEFSVVIPSKNRRALLERCLQALERQDVGLERFEVIVVDDGSAEEYEPVEMGLEVRWLRTAGVGPAKARNVGARAAKGRWVVLTDDDCEPAAGWLKELGTVLRRAPEALVGGRVENGLRACAGSEASQVLLDYLYEYYSGPSKGSRFFASCNFALSTELYEEMGGFDERFPLAAGEDRDFCDRWLMAGRRMEYASGAVVTHRHELPWRRFLKQHYTYGRGAWYYHQARKERGGGAVPVEPPGFLMGMLARPFRAEGVRWRVAVAALIGLSVAMNALGYFREKGRGTELGAGRAVEPKAMAAAGD